MIRVCLDGATADSRLVTRAIAEAASEVALRSHSLPWLPYDPPVIVASLSTFGLVYQTQEFGGPRPLGHPIPLHDTLFGLPVEVDNTLRLGDLYVIDRRTMNREKVELECYA